MFSFFPQCWFLELPVWGFCYPGGFVICVGFCFTCVSFCFTCGGFVICAGFLLYVWVLFYLCRYFFFYLCGILFTPVGFCFTCVGVVRF